MKKSIRIIMSLLVSVCMLAVLLPVAVYATVPTVWITDSADKVWDNAAMLTGAATSISLYAARNEYESAQICVYNPNGSALTVSSISCSSLASGGNTIPATGITVRREYVHASIQEHDISGGGDRDVKPAGASGWPDALVEPGDTIGTWNSQSIAAGKTGVFWYQAYVPSGTATGTYTGTAVVNTNQGNVTVNVSIKVFSPTIPGITDASSMNCYDWQHTSWGYTWATYGITDYRYSNPQVIQLLQNMAANMKKNRLNVVMVPLISMLGDTIVSDNGDYDTYTFNWDQLDAYLQIFIDAGCCKYFQISNASGYPTFQAIWSDNGVKTSGSVAWNSTVGQNYISQLYPSLYSHLNSLGLANKAILYAADEVNDDDARDAYNWFAAQWRSASAFGASGMVESAQYNETYYNQLNASIFCPTQIMYKDCAVYYQDQVMNYGKKLDMYYLNNPQGGYLNKYISMQLDRPRLFPLYVAHESGSGILFWAYDCFPGYNGGTQVGAFDNSHSGDETFTYPDTSRMSFYDSIRLESQLEGLEDAEIYKLLKATKPIEADKIYNNIITDPNDLTKYTRNGENVNQAHRNMLEAFDSGKPDGYDYRAAWGFNSSASDSSGNGYTMTLHGGAAYDTADYVEGMASLSFDGTDDYAGISGAVETATDNITMSAWVKWGGDTGYHQTIIYNGNNLSNGYGITMDHSASNHICIVVGGVNTLSSTYSLSAGVWTHVAAVRRNGTWELYINGTSVTLSSTSATPVIPSGSTYIGALPGNNDCFFKGKADDVRISNRALDISELQELANRGSPEDYKAAWYLNSSVSDSSGNGNDMTAYGSPTYSTSDKKEGTASLSLNGSSQYLKRSTPVTTATDNVTISAWLNWGGATSNGQVIVYNGNDSGSGYGICIDHNNSDHLCVVVGGVYTMQTGYSLPVGVWTHVVAVRRSGIWEFYINGSSVALTGNTSAPNTPAGYTTIGVSPAGTTCFFNGKIDEVKIFDRALQPAQILKEASASDDYKAVWYLNSSAVDSSGNGCDMTTYGSPTYNTSDKKEGTASVSLNGSSQYLKRSAPTITATDNITMSAWLNWGGATSNGQVIVYNGNDSGNGYGICLDHNNSDHLCVVVGGVYTMETGYNLPVGVWTHVAAVRRSGTWEFYINGSSVALTGNTSAPNTPADYTTIGVSPAGTTCFYKGMVDQVKIYDRALTPNQIAENYYEPFTDNFNDNSLSGSWATYGGTWSESSGVLAQTSTANGDPKKAIVSNAGLGTSTAYMITAKVKVTSWTDGDYARAGVGLFTGTGDGRGYNLVFHNDHSTVQFLDDYVAWDNTVYTFTWSDNTWYWFKLKYENGTLYGRIWADGTSEPATWLYSKSWSGRTGYPSLNGGSSQAGNGTSAASFDDISVTQVP